VVRRDARTRRTQHPRPHLKAYVVASAFDSTLVLSSCGIALSENLGLSPSRFEDKTVSLRAQNLVQPGAELTYLLLHDPEYRTRTRKEHLVRAGHEILPKRNVRELAAFLGGGIDACRFDFHIISALPQDMVESALEDIVPADHIHGTRLLYDASGKVEGAARVNTGHGKVMVLDSLQDVTWAGVIYMGGSSSDVHAMLYVNARQGLTIAASEDRSIAHIARRTVLSDDALSLLVPILRDIIGWDTKRICAFWDAHGLTVYDWEQLWTAPILSPYGPV